MESRRDGPTVLVAHRASRDLTPNERRGADRPFASPIRVNPVDSGVPVARADSDSAIPDQSDSNDYGIRVAA